MLDDDAIAVDEDDLDRALSPRSCADDAPLFRIDDDLFIGLDPEAAGMPEPAAGSGRAALGAAPSGRAFLLQDELSDPPADDESIIDRDDEVPERFWAPEVAGLGRRALALLVDQLLLIGVLGLFFVAALAALQHSGLTSGLLLTAGGLQASALPFALLAALLSLASSMFFHGSTGRTPGKALAGVQVRSAAGGAITWGQALLRWLGAALGLVCAGVGIAWAIFEPRRRGWADLISGTVVARPQREPGP